ncbi:uncharacterized protein LOC128742113 [Sabethes cyaneus]|uniref:uncharacterized protein LOC128742113 n=1 Tax=Sabethes cyaneus TaxID=53552 RepID=UPI00237ED0A0|nr:uncharacterized protein LOC128742113 [Sabethes cyaneus]
MNELILLNWEISNLTKTLTTHRKGSAIKIKTVDLLNQLLDTVSLFLTNHSIVPTDKCGVDEFILDEYFILPKVICRRCNLMMKYKQSQMLEHAKVHSKSKASLLLESLKGRNEQNVQVNTKSSEANEVKLINSEAKTKKSKNRKKKPKAVLEPIINGQPTSKLPPTVREGIPHTNAKSSCDQSKKGIDVNNEITKKPATVQITLRPSAPDATMSTKIVQKPPKNDQLTTKLPPTVRKGTSQLDGKSPHEQYMQGDDVKKDITRNPATAPVKSCRCALDSTMSTENVQQPATSIAVEIDEGNSNADDKDQCERSIKDITKESVTQIKTSPCPLDSMTSNKDVQQSETLTAAVDCKSADKETNVSVLPFHKVYAPATTKEENHDKIVRPRRKPRKRGHPENITCIEKGCIPICDIDLTKKLKKFLQKIPIEYVRNRTKHNLMVMKSSVHTNIAQGLEKLLRLFFPKVKAYAFGSRITGLAGETSDLDIFLDLDDCYDGQNCSKVNQELYVRTVEHILRDSNEWMYFDAVISARTPILRAWNISEKVDCDISFANGLSHRNSMLIKYMFELQPIAYSMAIYIKEWAKYANISGLNSYTLTMLIFFFLQKKELLPSVYRLQFDCKPPLYIKRWQADFERKTLEELKITAAEETSTDVLLASFFLFYGRIFPIETHVICPYLGMAPRKTDFDPNQFKWPVQMKALADFYDQLSSDRYTSNDILAYTKPIVVQDPFDLAHNVAKGLDLADASKFIHYCTQSASELEQQFTRLNNVSALEALQTMKMNAHLPCN